MFKKNDFEDTNFVDKYEKLYQISYTNKSFINCFHLLMLTKEMWKFKYFFYLVTDYFFGFIT